MAVWKGLAATAMLAAAVAGCAPAPPKTVTVSIRDMAFSPLTVQVRPGDTVRWVNQDIFIHSATAADKQFDVELPVGGEGQTVVKSPGEIDYTCRYHPNMKGRILATG
ncbi:MAG TPA: cupredoxin domain-containing protein [Caulobacteraceae bacterium]|jgi:plastocyanin